MAKGLYGRKVGMTQIFGTEGQRIPVTVLEVGPCPIVRVKSENGVDGYNAVVIGFGTKKAKHINKPDAGLFAKANMEPCAHIKEMRVSAEDVAAIEAGVVLTAEAFQPGQLVDIVGKTKGRGFTGVIKRHNYHMPTTPGRVFLNKKMAGHYGDERVTIQNLTVVQVEADKNLVVVRGSVPGPNGSLLWIQEAARVATKKG
jgi:large subunit ribosomal protein L3